MQRRGVTALAGSLAAAALLLSGCSAGQSHSSSTAASGRDGNDFSLPSPSLRDREGTDNTPAKPDSDFTLPTSTNPVQEDSRGRLVKGVGDLAGVILQDDPSQRLVNFSVDSITPDYQCPVNKDLKPQNGHFIAVHIQVQALPGLGNSRTPYFGVSPKDFDVESPSGAPNTKTLDTWAAHACLDDGSGLPAKIGPGQKEQGTVVLDATADSGTVVLSQRNTDGPGWVWKIPASGKGS